MNNPNESPEATKPNTKVPEQSEVVSFPSAKHTPAETRKPHSLLDELDQLVTAERLLEIIWAPESRPRSGFISGGA